MRALLHEKFDVAQDGCWIWTGSTTNHGNYGKWRRTTAQRAMYAAAGLSIPEGYELDHLCRITLCVNPDHLEPVTREENLRRKRAALTRCKSGHPYDEANTYLRPNGQRDCRACIRDRSAAYRVRKSGVAA